MARVSASVLAAALVPLAMPGQTSPAAADSPAKRTVVAGTPYGAGWLHRLLLGAHYRDLWTVPLQVEVLDLAGFAGGLTPIKRGGGRQTTSLRFRGGDGHEYVFRSVDKEAAEALPPELRATLAERIAQDQVSALHPAAALVVEPLLDAVGVLHARPQLLVMPDDPRLAEFRADFGGMLGMLEERPNADPNGELTFAGAREVIGTAPLLERVDQGARDRVDARAFLVARLLDIYVGDPDRHADQWRWARFDKGEVHVWQPIPRDRDQAFSRLDGLFLALARFTHPEWVGFGPDYPDLFGLTWRAQDLDRRFLVELDKRVWDSVVVALQGRLTDSVIDLAVHRLPPEFYRLNGETLSRALRRRRDRLPDAGDRFYRLVSRDADVHATDQPDVADVVRLDDQHVEVQLSRRRDSPYFDRVFDRHETHEIRLYLHGGDDRAVVRDGGSGARSILLRVLGGGGDDELIDSSRVGSGVLTRFYDDRGHNRFVRGAETKVDDRAFAPAKAPDPFHAQPRDWGYKWAPSPWAVFVPDVGLVFGGGPVLYQYGFRRVPYRSRTALRVGYATTARRFRAEFSGDFRSLGSTRELLFYARASGIEVVRFFGFGNETLRPASDALSRIRQQQYIVAPTLVLPLSATTRLSLGPVLQFARTDSEPGTVLDLTRPYGVGSFGQVGSQVAFTLDTRDQPAAASRGALVTVGGSVYPALWDVGTAFGEAHGAAATALTAPLPTHPTLALRVGGKKVWGTYPFHEAAYIGGASTVRGFSEHRFAGDAALYGNAELRLKLARSALVFPADFGLFGLADAGRVYLRGETSDRWHAAVGGGVWIAFLSPANTFTVGFARSVERTAVYARAGFLF